MRTKILHKCLVYWEPEAQVWVVEDIACGDFAENKSWRRAVYIGIYHFKLELTDAINNVIREHNMRKPGFSRR